MLETATLVLRDLDWLLEVALDRDIDGDFKLLLLAVLNGHSIDRLELLWRQPRDLWRLLLPSEGSAGPLLLHSVPRLVLVHYPFVLGEETLLGAFSLRLLVLQGLSAHKRLPPTQPFILIRRHISSFIALPILVDTLSSIGVALVDRFELLQLLYIAFSDVVLDFLNVHLLLIHHIAVPVLGAVGAPLALQAELGLAAHSVDLLHLLPLQLADLVDKVGFFEV
eukprot:CAMPEP_0170554132 /NCGR_PEP_ID=MMETSP0211-20121228/12013_1 /TAXON_ID=311385 /ORGANISM="Pseudokeronopsis sp., Strain OXSARD2" /LENGTH=222 /DNA_ID=CAMNT_0010863005 /DNA_START=661 /DNA_END=1329 /DNA_ORIENTATION=-